MIRCDVSGSSNTPMTKVTYLELNCPWILICKIRSKESPLLTKVQLTRSSSFWSMLFNLGRDGLKEVLWHSYNGLQLQWTTWTTFRLQQLTIGTIYSWPIKGAMTWLEKSSENWGEGPWSFGRVVCFFKRKTYPVYHLNAISIKDMYKNKKQTYQEWIITNVSQDNRFISFCTINPVLNLGQINVHGKGERKESNTTNLSKPISFAQSSHCYMHE